MGRRRRWGEGPPAMLALFIMKVTARCLFVYTWLVKELAGAVIMLAYAVLLAYGDISARHS